MSFSHPVTVMRSQHANDLSSFPINYANEHGLPYFVGNGDIVLKLEDEDSLVEFFRDTLLAGLSMQIDVYMNPNGTGACFLQDAKSGKFAMAFGLAIQSPGTCTVYGMAYAGASSLQLLIMDRLNSHRVVKDEEPTPEGTYDITVYEYFIDKDENGVERLKNTHHSINTGSALQGLRAEMYPYLDVRKMIDTYLGSRENIFMLYGEPGVGKTCLMKTVLRETAQIMDSGFSAVYVKDTAVLKRPDFWVKINSMTSTGGSAGKAIRQLLVGNDSSVVYLILDDLDNELGARTAERDNFIVSQLLSFSDGLFEKTLKVIITTNQPIVNIDKALIRPGRCFDVLNLRGLSRAEALELWTTAFGMTEETFGSSFHDAQYVSQAAFISEYERVSVMSASKDYLVDPSISVRQDLIRGLA